MPKGKEAEAIRKSHWLHVSRAVVAIFALLVAAGHLAYLIPSTAGFSAPTHTSNSTFPSNALGSGSAASHTSYGGFMAFNELDFWFAVEVIAYTLIALVFLMGLRTWYTLSNLFNIFNLGIYILSGYVAIPGITAFAFGSRFHSLLGLSTINIIFVSWVVVLIVGLVLQKYDPGSKLDELLVTRKVK